MTPAKCAEGYYFMPKSLNSVIKIFMNSICTLIFVYYITVDFQDGANDLDVGVNESIIILLFCMPHDAYECPKVLLNVDSNARILIESDICGNVCFFALTTVTLHYWLPFQANDCVFSRYEQQKVYCSLEYPHLPPTYLLFYHVYKFHWQSKQITVQGIHAYNCV